jgi:hypothetical protein
MEPISKGSLKYATALPTEKPEGAIQDMPDGN